MNKFKYNKDYTLTKFLDFDEQKEIYKNIERGSIIILNGGYETAERKRAIITFSNDDVQFEDFNIKIYEICFESNLKVISHRHILGTLMSLGINRNSFGDILISNEKYYLFVTDEISKYIEQNFIMVNHVPLKLIHITDVNEIVIDGPKEENINVSSMRLDAIIARTLKKSRSDSAEIITKGLVLINHKECLNTSYNVKINDVISIRHFGRIEVLEILKTTKKDRLVLKIGVRK